MDILLGQGMMEQLKKVYVDRVVSNGFEDGFLYNNDQLMKLGDIEKSDFFYDFQVYSWDSF